MCGQPVELDELMNICSENNLVLIEDASHSLGATYKGRMVGSIAHMTTFSFHPVKNITTGEGGVVVTNNEAFATACRAFRSHGIDTNYKMREKTSRHQYDMTSLGFNYRLTDIQCALGISQLYKCRGFIQKRQAIAKTYDKALENIAGIHLLRTKEHVTNAHHLYVIFLDLDSLKCTRDDFYRAMIAENI
jgi:perosamine synthetase